MRYKVLEDLDDTQVKMQGLQTHPREGGEQKVVQEEAGGDAKANSIGIECQPWVYQEDHVEKEKCKTQLDEDLGWNVFADFAEEIKSREKNKHDFINHFMFEEDMKGFFLTHSKAR